MKQDFNVVNDVIKQRSIKRLIQLASLAQVTFLIVSITNIVVFAYIDFVISFSIVLLLFFIKWIAKKGEYQTAVKSFIYSSTLMLAALAFNGYGIFDQALYGYCGVLVYTSIVGSKRLLITLTILMSMSCILIVLFNDTGETLGLTDAYAYRATFDIILGLSAVGAASWILHSDNLFIIESLDSSNQKVIKSQELIQHNAIHDGLTGLPNRAGIDAQFQTMLKQCEENNSPLAVLFIDLDSLKNINDSMGHLAGDEMLMHVTNRLNKLLKKEQICRYGADDFIIFLPLDLIDTKVFANKIIQSLKKSMLINSVELKISCSIGITVLCKENASIDLLIKEADSAMFKSKELGKNHYQVFDPTYYEQIELAKTMSESILKSIEENDFTLHYQPKINLKTNTVQGFEALIRWTHPQLGFISPITFIPLAEKNGNIVELGRWIINEACKQAKKWHDDGYRDFSIAINVSIVQFQRDQIDQFFSDKLAEYQLDSKHIEIEITESLFLDDSESEDMNVLFENIKNQGIQLSIDDFGTGYSNMGYLKKLDVKYLKIDRSFIQNIQSNSQDLIIVKAIIQLAKNLDIKTVAEGVESLDISDVLKQLDCDIVQGFYYSKPGNPLFIETHWNKDNTWSIPE